MKTTDVTTEGYAVGGNVHAARIMPWTGRWRRFLIAMNTPLTPKQDVIVMGIILVIVSVTLVVTALPLAQVFGYPQRQQTQIDTLYTQLTADDGANFTTVRKHLPSNLLGGTYTVSDPVTRWAVGDTGKSAKLTRGTGEPGAFQVTWRALGGYFISCSTVTRSCLQSANDGNNGIKVMPWAISRR